MEMESLVSKAITYGGIKRFFRRRRYQRLDRAAVGRKMRVIRLKGSPEQKQYWMRIRTTPRLRWVIRTPLKMLTKLKNGYMNLMLRLAGSVGALNADTNILGAKRIPRARHVSSSKGCYSGDAFEARLIYEISKTLVASHELYPM